MASLFGLRSLADLRLASILIVILGATFVSEGIAEEHSTLEIHDGRVTLKAESVDLQRLLQQLAAQGGFKLWLSADLPAQALDVDIDDLSMQETLRDLLVDNSFALVNDAAGSVSALYVLPVGEDAEPMNRVLGSEPAELREQMLRNALASNSLPDNIKAAMLAQFHNNGESVLQSTAAQRPAAIEKLIETLQQLGNPNSATMRQLEQSLAREISLQNRQ